MLTLLIMSKPTYFTCSYIQHSQQQLGLNRFNSLSKPRSLDDTIYNTRLRPTLHDYKNVDMNTVTPTLTIAAWYHSEGK